MNILNVYRCHYFLYLGALSGVLNFSSLFVKAHISATMADLGNLYFVLPFLVLITKPFFCSIADKYACHRSMLIFSIIFSSLGFSSLIIIPYLPKSRFLWPFFCINLTLGSLSSGIANSITDCLVMKATDSHGSNYGAIRTWGTFAWGLFNLFIGFLNSIPESILPLYVPGFLLFFLLSVIDLLFIIVNFSILISKKSSDKLDAANCSIRTPDIPPTSFPSNSQELRKSNLPLIIFRTFIHHPRLMQYCIICIVVGALNGVAWQFLPVYLDHISPKDFNLIALTFAIQCFIGEIPFLYFSKSLVKLLGVHTCLNLILLTFTARYFFYAFLPATYAYHVLWVEFTQGITYGLFSYILNYLAAEYGLKASIEAHNYIKKQKEKLDEIEQANSDNVFSISIASVENQKYMTPGICNDNLISSVPVHLKQNIFNHEDLDSSKYETPTCDSKEFLRQIKNNEFKDSRRNSQQSSSISTLENLPEKHKLDARLCTSDISFIDSENQENSLTIKDSYICSTIQGVLSGCFEGLGVAIGSIAFGHLVHMFNFSYAWKISAFFALIFFILNFSIEIFVILYTTIRNFKKNDV